MAEMNRPGFHAVLEYAEKAKLHLHQLAAVVEVASAPSARCKADRRWPT
jgi:hypothetical protein